MGSHLWLGPHPELAEAAMSPQCPERPPLRLGPEGCLAAGNPPIVVPYLGIYGCHHTSRSQLAGEVGEDTHGEVHLDRSFWEVQFN